MFEIRGGLFCLFSICFEMSGLGLGPLKNRKSGMLLPRPKLQRALGITISPAIF